jgi:hypothetical protein
MTPPTEPSKQREILDYVLTNTYEQKDYLDVKQFFCSNNENFPSGDEYYLKIVLNKLNLDGYIDFIRISGHLGQYITGHQAGEGMSIRRNFNGHLFLAKGGYEGEHIGRILNEVRVVSNETDLVKWTKQLSERTRKLMVATWAVAIGAIGLVVWEVVQKIFFD